MCFPVWIIRLRSTWQARQAPLTTFLTRPRNLLLERVCCQYTKASGVQINKRGGTGSASLALKKHNCRSSDRFARAVRCSRSAPRHLSCPTRSSPNPISGIAIDARMPTDVNRHCSPTRAARQVMLLQQGSACLPGHYAIQHVHGTCARTTNRQLQVL